MPNEEDTQHFGSVFAFGQSPIGASDKTVHPWPTYAPVGDEIESNNYEYVEREGVTDQPREGTIPSGDTLTPIVALRQETAAVPVINRTPALLHYPKSIRTLFIPSGQDFDQLSLGFDCRALVVQNVGTNSFLFCRELNLYLTTGPTVLATFNLPGMAESLSFEWHTAAFNPVAPAAVPGEGAIIQCFDEWVPPVTAASSSGGGGGSTNPTTGTQSSVAAAAADTQLLASNTARKGATIANDSATATLYVLFGSGVASASNFSEVLSPIVSTIPGMLEVPFGYTGKIRGFWSAAVGNARITELT